MGGVAAVGLMLATGAAGVALSAHLPGVPRARRDPWADEVARRLPDALAVQPPARAGVPTLHRARASGGGWSWRLDLPGSTQPEDWSAPRIAAALNTGGQIVAAAELEHVADGWADLQLWHRDPLTDPQPVPWAPGTVPDCCPVGTVCIGRRRSGEHIHMDVLTDAGATATLLAGRRGSGKSETLRLVCAQMAAWGWAPPIVVDLVRRGADYAALGPVLGRPVVTDPREALALVRALRAECAHRADRLVADGRQKIGAYDASVPLLPLVIDEMHAAMTDRKLRSELVDYARETRPMGGAFLGATQYPTVQAIDPLLRAQISNVWCGRVRSHVEAGVVFGSLPDGQGPQHLRLGPGGCVVDVDGPDLLVGRSWRIDDAWLGEHVRRLAS